MADAMSEVVELTVDEDGTTTSVAGVMLGTIIVAVDIGGDVDDAVVEEGVTYGVYVYVVPVTPRMVLGQSQFDGLNHDVSLATF